MVIMYEEDVIYDVVIIGGGLSGLTAAYQLLEHNKSQKVRILEAKDRVGGRTFTTTMKSASGEDKWDLGGQWVGRPQIHVMQLLKDLGFEVHTQYNKGEKLARLSDGKIRKYTTSLPFLSPLSYIDLFFAINKVNKLCDDVQLEDLFKSANARELDSMTMETFMQKHCWTKDTKELIDTACAVIFGAPLSQISALFFLHYCKRAGGIEPILESNEGSAQEWKIKGGAQGISLKLLEIVGKDNVLLGEPVVEINQENKDVVQIMTKTGKKLLSKYVIMAVPPHQAMKICFTPSLPFKKEQLLCHMPVGSTIKFAITYESPFWRKMGLSGEVVSYDNFDVEDETEGRNTSFNDDAPVSIVYDATTEYGNGALIGFICGLAATRWTDKTEKETKNGIVNFLKKCFGDEAKNYIDFAIKDWSKDPWNGGCPVNYASPGALSVYQHLLREPFERIHWAGTETATSWSGYMNGAVQAGIRSANEIQKRLDPTFVIPLSEELPTKKEKPASMLGNFGIFGIIIILLVAIFVGVWFAK